MSNFFSKNAGTFGNIFGSAIDAGINGSMPSVNKPTGNMDSPYFYQGQYQPQIDQQFYGNTQNYGAYNPYLSGGYQQGFQGTYNAGQGVQPGLQQYYQATQNNPYTQGYQQMADWSGGGQGQYSQLGNQTSFGGQQVNDTALSGLHTVNQLLPETFNYQYANPMIQGAQQGGQMLQGVGQQALSDAAGLGSAAQGYSQPLTNYASSGLNTLQGVTQGATAGLLPYAQSQAAQLPGLAQSYAQPGQQAGLQTLQTAFDPQSQLYARSFQQNQDQTRATLAARGLNRSLVGAGAEADSNRNFNLDWQNNQLGRQVAGLGAYGQQAQQGYGMQSGATGQGLQGLLGASQGTYNPYATTYGSGTTALSDAARTAYGLQQSAATTASDLGTAGANAYTQGAAQPWQASQNVFNNQLNQIGTLGGISGQYGGQLGQASNYGQQGLAQRNMGGQLPYQTYGQIQGDQYLGANNYLSGLGGVNQLGLQGLSGAQAGSGINLAQNNSLLQYLQQGTNSAGQYGQANNGWLYGSMLPYQGMYASGKGGSSMGGDIAKLGLSALSFL